MKHLKLFDEYVIDINSGNTIEIPKFKSDYEYIIELKPSKLGGLGVFAKTDIEQDETFRFDGDVIKWDDSLDIYTKLRLFPYSKTEGILLHNEGSFFNHSLTPNISTIKIGKKIMFYTNRYISEGEELLINYGKKYNDLITKNI